MLVADHVELPRFREQRKRVWKNDAVGAVGELGGQNHHGTARSQELVSARVHQEKACKNDNNDANAVQAVRKNLKHATRDEQDGEQKYEGTALAERRGAAVAGLAYHWVQK